MSYIPKETPYLPKYYLVLLGIACLLVGYLGVELWVNHRFGVVDFEVYYKAALRISNGENLYRMGEIADGGDGHFRYKYAPTAAVFFIPFTFFPFWLAGILYWIFLSFLVVHSIHLLIRKAFPRYQPIPAHRLPLIPFIAALCVGVHIEFEIHLGQVNLLLLYGYLWIIIWYISGYNRFFIAFVWAATLFVKPYGLIFVPYFMVLRQWRLLAFLLAGIAFWLVCPLFFFKNINLWAAQHIAWLQELKIELAAKQTLLQNDNYTLFSVLARYSPLRWTNIDENPILKITFQLVVVVGLGVLILRAMRHNYFGISIGHLFHFALLMLCIPLLAQTNRNAFLYALPAIVLILLHWRSLPFGFKIAVSIGFLFYGGNIRDLWGRQLAPLWDSFSLLTLGTLLITATLFALLLKKPK